MLTIRKKTAKQYTLHCSERAININFLNEQSKEHALDELKKFKDRRLSPAEEDYMEAIKELNLKAKNGIKK